ncbi:S41 family peptidase [Roseospirillum parvum]|uniref:Carboxyl-terminal processing protease n=1 Tax=Roseospirillum parvum TaxID=83401 RepID=A0A1G7VBL0_9PROT|nr:S41 family peptidase [Roseospirillum parvum]SDG56938.1 carboxyl-terminal processing protease [Roseospirillum parvum]
MHRPWRPGVPTPHFFYSVLGGFLLVALAVGCTPGGPPADHAELPRALAEVQDPAFKVGPARHLVDYGFEAIEDRYIHPVAADRLALAGLAGLGRLDPAISVTPAEGRVILSRDAEQVADFAAPRADDTEAWANLAVAITRAGRAVSPTLMAASQEDIYEALFDAALADLDGYSRYASAAEARDHRASRNGFGGIGIHFGIIEAGVDVRQVIPGSPADRAGLAVGDTIISIDGRPASGLSIEQVKETLRGPIDSSCRLGVLGPEARTPRDVTLRRALVVPNTVSAERRGEVLVITLSSFNQRTARAVSDVLDGLPGEPPVQGLVLDMRGNPGGLLDQAVAVSDLFLRRGRIVFTRGRHPESRQSYDAGGGDLAHDLPMAVVIDGRSASAAEIVAAALQDAGRAVVIGTTSYGKGTVQTVIRLPNDGEMTLTWSRFHSPSGYALEGLGVLPTLCTSRPDGRAVSEAESAGLLAPLRQGDPVVATRLARWRATRPGDEAARQALRAACPARAHSTSDDDLELAVRLLGDGGLYENAVQVASHAPPARDY